MTKYFKRWWKKEDRHHNTAVRQSNMPISVISWQPLVGLKPMTLAFCTISFSLLNIIIHILNAPCDELCPQFFSQWAGIHPRLILYAFLHYQVKSVSFEQVLLCCCLTFLRNTWSDFSYIHICSFPTVWNYKCQCLLSIVCVCLLCVCSCRVQNLASSLCSASFHYSQYKANCY